MLYYSRDKIKACTVVEKGKKNPFSDSRSELRLGKDKVKENVREYNRWHEPNRNMYIIHTASEQKNAY